jgi:ABC-type uncharacterized transport system ATPase subunit
LLSSHILSSLTHLCDDIFVLNKGIFEKIVYPDAYADLKSNFTENISGQIQSTLDQLL